MPTLSIDLGSGPEPRNPFGADTVRGVDLRPFPGGLVARLGFEPLPFADSSVDFVSAFDLLEHVPRYDGAAPGGFPFLFLMSEIWRVLRPDGRFFAQTPAFPSPTAFSDPTHVNFITADTAAYFGRQLQGDGAVVADDRLDLCRRYGFTGEFLVLRNYASPQFGHQIWLFQAIKPATPAAAG